MIHVLEFIGRVLFSIFVFSTCLSLMWFITWVLILQHVSFFREVVIGKNTPQCSPARISSGGSKRTPKCSSNIVQNLSPLYSNGSRSKSSIKSFPRSPLLLPPPSPLILPPPIIHTPENDVFYSLGPPMTPDDKMRLVRKKTSSDIKQTSIIPPCNVQKYIYNWF
jgi:hypothetical protein